MNTNKIAAAIAARKQKQEDSAPSVSQDVTESDETVVLQESELVFPGEPKSQEAETVPTAEETSTPIEEATADSTTPRKRGRPAKGKRSNDDWIGRTFYIKRDTDLDAEELLLKLKRKGVEIDKSELVEKLLAAWVRWQNGENIEICLDEISPIQK